jgi:hypothetical protein
VAKSDWDRQTPGKMARIDLSVIELCQRMKPEERLEAAARLSELVLEFGRAGERHRRQRRRHPASGGDGVDS